MIFLLLSFWWMKPDLMIFYDFFFLKELASMVKDFQSEFFVKKPQLPFKYTLLQVRHGINAVFAVNVNLKRSFNADSLNLCKDHVFILHTSFLKFFIFSPIYQTYLSAYLIWVSNPNECKIFQDTFAFQSTKLWHWIILS